MREILFRGKKVSNNEWVYGDYIRLLIDDNPFIHIPGKLAASEIIPETVGQYIGLKTRDAFQDKYLPRKLQSSPPKNLSKWENKKIFEDDIVEIMTGGGNKELGVIKFMLCAFVTVPLSPKRIKQAHLFNTENLPYIKIIGNIHDNPELLKII